MFLPALADPYAFIYEKQILDTDPHWYETISWDRVHSGRQLRDWPIDAGVRDPELLPCGKPYLDGFEGILAPKQSVRVAAIRADRAAIEFRGFPPPRATNW